jgi:hypothetical protein
MPTPSHMPDYEALLSICDNDYQTDFVKALIQHGTVSAASAATNKAERRGYRMLARLRQKLALQQPPDPREFGHRVPEPQAIKGISQLDKINPDGSREPRLQWVKTNVPVAHQIEAIKAAAEAAFEDIPPAQPRAVTPCGVDDLAVFIAITDYHFGMYAWGEETGADWNLEIAEQVFYDTICNLMARAGPAQRCYLALMGDLLHTDNLSSKTPTSGHELDSAGRFPETVRAVIRSIRRVVELARARYPEVVIIVAEGNHDIVTSGLWLPEVLRPIYASTPEVEVASSSGPYHVYEWGQNMIGVHHGHMLKKESLPLYYAARWPEIWGRTRFRHIHTGHYHHLDERGHAGARVFQHTTLAANDAYSARAGYVADREAVAIIYHKTKGQRGRVYEPPGR